MLRILAVLIAISAASPAFAGEVIADVTVNDCDRFAGHPYDPAKTAGGVVFDDIDPVEALISCATAFSRKPEIVRYKYQYGRALLAANRPNEAMIFLHASASSGYAAAQQTLATLLYEDKGLLINKHLAIDLFHKAAAQGHAVAQLRVAAFYLRGEGKERDLPKAHAFVRQAADQGLPAALAALKIIAGTKIIAGIKVALN